MQTVKLTIAYDGSDFHGWQLQPGLPTIQGALHDALRQITQEQITVHGASRTDAGVHAQWAKSRISRRTRLSTAAEIQRSMNALLPPTMRIVAAQEVGQDFHSRWMAQGKTYRYRIYRGRCPAALRSSAAPSTIPGRSMKPPCPPPPAPSKASTISRPSPHPPARKKTTKIATCNGLIHSSEIVREPAATKSSYIVRGRSFLRYMVRKIVGTLIEVGKGRLAPADIPKFSKPATAPAPAPQFRLKDFTWWLSNILTPPIRSPSFATAPHEPRTPDNSPELVA